MPFNLPTTSTEVGKKKVLTPKYTMMTWESKDVSSSPWVQNTLQLPADEGYMYSEGHPMPPWRLESLIGKEGGCDVGGPWNQFRRQTKYVLGVARSQGAAGRQRRGQWAVTGSRVGVVTNLPVVQSPRSDSDLVTLGGTAISMTEPTESEAALTTFLGELYNDGVPSIIGSGMLKSKANIFKGAGSEYLNVEFGWKPFVAELRSFANAVVNSEDILAGYHAGSNRKLKRRYSFPTETANGIYTGQMQVSGSHNLLGFPQGTVSRKTMQETWFSGAFRYYIPVGDDLVGKFSSWASDCRKLLGAELTPEVLWNLAPWSWAVDWFSNFGDIMHNISALGTDGLTMQYGYIMSRATTVDTGSAELVDSDGIKQRASYSQRTEYKKRLPASPYGFGVLEADLSTRQLAILVSLGFVRT